MIKDRRNKRRLQLKDELVANLYLSGASRPLVGVVVEVAEGGLKVVIESGGAPVPRVGTVVKQVEFVTERSTTDSVRNLTIRRVESGGPRGPQIWMDATENTARSLLWRLMAEMTIPDTRYSMEVAVQKKGPPRIPARGEYTEAARMERLKWTQKETGTDLSYFSTTKLRADRLTGNIENMIGALEIPIGLAGPLWIRGSRVKGMIYAPMATTEGALVASATRGAKAITLSGGCTTRVIQQRMQRAPLFVLSDMHGALLFNNWILDHMREIREQIGRVSRHAKLVSVDPFLLGNMVHLRFHYETGDAAGQNMTTATTWQACQWIMKQLAEFPEIVFENFIIEANMSGDKKVNFQSFITGRGTRVIAEAFLSREALSKVLKVTPEDIAKCNAGFMAGSIQIGMVGYNINVANVIAAVFAATGQDIASVHESGLGQLHLQAVDDGLYASMLLPSLIVGTVGGGTHLPGQQALLDVMGCAGPDKSSRLAEIIAGFCLALDLSTLSAIANGQFATAHERLGRNRPVKWFVREDLNRALFEPMLQTAFWDGSLQVDQITEIPFEMGSSIITELTSRKLDKFVGLVPLRIGFKGVSDGGGASAVDVLVKVKPTDDEVMLMMNQMASMCEARLAREYSRFGHLTGFAKCHIRELAVYGQNDPRFRKNVPRVYGIHRDDTREAYVLVLEKLDDVILLNTADDVSGWKPEHIEAVLRGAAEIHSVWMGREEELKKNPAIGHYPTAAAMSEMRPLWKHLGVHGQEEFPNWFSESDLERFRRMVQTIPKWWAEIDRMPKTMIHNDFNPRNLCLRREGDGYRLCVYDWELATLHLPQHDVAEFLAFVLPNNVAKETVENYVDFHREVLEEACGRRYDPDEWLRGFHLCVRDLVVNRFSLYVMAHTFRHYGFLARTTMTLRRFLDLAPGLTEGDGA